MIKYSLCVSGAAGGPVVDQSKEKAYQLGVAIARAGHVLTTGATIGLPFFAAQGAKDEGGLSIGFSPAANLREHVAKYRFPLGVFDYINFTGMDMVHRDVHLVTLERRCFNGWWPDRQLTRVCHCSRIGDSLWSFNRQRRGGRHHLGNYRSPRATQNRSAGRF